MFDDLKNDSALRPLRVLAVAVEFTEPLAKVLFSYSGEGVLENWTFQEFVNLTVGNTFQVGNGVGGINDFMPLWERRNAAHLALAQQEPQVHKRLHFLLFRIATGYSHRHRHEVMPNYLRTMQATAYHLAFINPNVALPYYNAMLEIVKEAGASNNPYLPEGHLFLNRQLLTELKTSFDIFVGESVTDELCERTKFI